MAGSRILSVLTIRCVDCGDAERLITVTSTALISRCYVCGDVEVRARRAAGLRRRQPATPPPPRADRFAPVP